LITSKDNALVKRARAIRDGKIHEQIFIEGLRLAEEAAEALAPEEIQDVLYSERIRQDARGSSLLEKLKQEGGQLTSVSESVFATLSDTKTPQGIVFLAKRPKADKSALVNKGVETPLIVILHRINNPLNVGAIARTAEGAGATAIISTTGTADLFSPKALRGAMGSSFRLPLWAGSTFFEAISFCREHGIRTVCADLHATRAHTEINWTIPCALILGAEASGLTASEVAAADESLRIYMRPPVESLNVAVAAGVILYEAARQRAESSRQ